MHVTMATTNLFAHPAFKDGAFTSNDRERAPRGDRQGDARHRSRRRARRRASTSSGAGARAARPAPPRTRDALERYREAINFLCGYVRDQGYELQLRHRAQAERAARRHLPAHRRPRAALHHDARPPRDGRRQPRGRARDDGRTRASSTASRRRCGPGKLFHIDLNAQRIGRFDQDYRFGAEDLKEAFHLVHLLETSGYDGPRHFDAHAYRERGRGGRLGLRRAAACAPISRWRRSPAQFDASDAIRRRGRRRSVDELAEPSVGRTRREPPRRCSASTPTSTRSPRAATTTSGSTSWSSDLLLGSGSMHAVRWGILSTARINRLFLDGVAPVGPSRSLAIASRDRRARGRVRRRARDRARHDSYEALLADPEIEAVYISLPNSLHSSGRCARWRPVSTCCARSRSAAAPGGRGAHSTPPSAKGGC